MLLDKELTIYFAKNTLKHASPLRLADFLFFRLVQTRHENELFHL